MSSFSPLQGEATNGKTKIWSIRVTEQDGHGVIETSHGYLHGKQQVNQKIISEGKNKGKKNETTPLQQAISEATTQFIKKKESGYHVCGNEENKEEKDEKHNKGKEIYETVPNPMLAHEYGKRGKSIQYPCYVQPKFDGVRCVAIPGKGLFSRNRKSYPHLEHIVSEINTLHPDMILDGELYSDTLTFQEIVGIVKRETVHEKQTDIRFHVYDIICTNIPYETRYLNLATLFKTPFHYIVPVVTELCESEIDMKHKHTQYTQEGYEGIMLRNKKGLYKHSRSADLQKYKEFMDDEYSVTSYTEGQGLEQGCVIWICVTPEGKSFHCRPRGSREYRQELYSNGTSYIGKKLTVRFQELTTDHIPRFPVGIAFREYE